MLSPNYPLHLLEKAFPKPGTQNAFNVSKIYIWVYDVVMLQLVKYLLYFRCINHPHKAAQLKLCATLVKLVNGY